jgi:hypothetical protein
MGRYTGEDVLSNDYIRMISTWLENCLSHPQCCQTISGGRRITARQAPLPTRCVEVLAGGLRLKETGSEVGAYITLSHRWTTESELSCTTAENIKERIDGNPAWFLDLPKTYLGAFDVARRLDVKYVWIDSLCIIQHGDDGADWRQESVRMADYYQQSLLTIAATAGSTDQGLIPPNSNSLPRLARLPYRDSNSCRHGYFYVYSYSLEVDQQYQSFIQDSELLSRGWVFQEWLLSRRIVYFTTSGAFFECAEQKPHNHRGEVSRFDNDVPVNGKQLAKISFERQDASNIRLWYQIAESYSALSLTKPEKDRIVALAGVAKEFREGVMREDLERMDGISSIKCGQEYVSGLWLRDLHRALLWERKSDECRPQRNEGFPTWSWASILCPVAWDLHDLRPEAELIAVATAQDEVFSIDSLQHRVDSVSLSPYLFDIDNKFTSLYMKGKLLQVSVRERFQNEDDLEIACLASGHDSESARNTWRVVCSRLEPTEITGWASFEHPDYQDDSVFQNGHEIQVLHISTAMRVRGGYGLGYLSWWHKMFDVLYIRNIQGQKYERVGIGRLFGKDIEKQIWTVANRYIELV